MMHVQISGVKIRNPRKKRSFFELDLSSFVNKDCEQSVSEFEAIFERNDYEHDEAEEPRLLDV